MCLKEPYLKLELHLLEACSLHSFKVHNLLFCFCGFDWLVDLILHKALFTLT